MDTFLTDFWKALGGKTADLAKRFSSAHRAGVTKIAGHVGKAMGFHKGAMMECQKAYKAAGDSMEDCVKALDHVHKAHEMHKAFCMKQAAATAGESIQYPHAEVNGHLEAAKAALTHGMSAHKALGEAHKAAHEKHSETHDQHELAKGAIMKVASSWVGQESTSPAAAGPGYTPAQAGHVENSPQSELTEGEVADYDPFMPYPGKAASVPATGGNQVTEAEAKVREENAALKARLDAAEKTITAFGNQPGPQPAGRTFAAPGQGGPQVAPGSVDALIKELYESGQISKLELDKFDTDPVVRARVTAKIIGLQAVKHERGDGSYAKSIMDPAFKGNEMTVTKRAAAGEGVFNPGFVARPNGTGVFGLK